MPGLLWIWTLREARAGWRLLLGTSLLIVIASALLALAPIFRDATGDRALERLLEQQPSTVFLNRIDRIRQQPTAEAAASIDRDVTAAAASHLPGLASAPLRLGVSRFGVVDSVPQYPTRFHVFADLESTTIVTDGRFASTPRTPEGRLAIMVGAEAAAHAGINVGDQWTFSIDVGLVQEAEVEVVGLLAPRGDDLRPFQGTDAWFDLIPLGMAPPGIGLFVSPAALFDAVGIDLPGLPIEYFVHQPLDLSSLNSNDVRTARQGMEAFANALRESPGTQVSTPLARVLRRFELEEGFAETPVLVVSLQMAAVAIFAVALLGADFARRSEQNRRRLRARGSSVGQEFQIQGLLGLGLALPAVALSAPLAAFALSQAGRTSALEAITDGATLDTRLSLAAWGLAAGTAAVAWLVFSGAVWLQRSGRATTGRSGLVSIRPGASLFHRTYLDFGLLAVAGVLFWQFDTESNRVSSSALGGDSVDPALLLSPGLLIAAVALILARFVPRILERVAQVASASTGPTWITLAFVALARDPGRAMRMLALTLFAAAIGAIAATYSATLDQSIVDRVHYDVGADLRAVAVSPGSSGSPRTVLSSLDGRPGVRLAGAATRSLGSLGLEASGSQTTLLGIQPERFGDLIEFRDDFASGSLQEVLDSIAVGGAPAGVALPLNARALVVWARTDPPDAELLVEAQIVDSNNRPWTLRLGVPRGGEWQRLETELPQPGPVRLLALAFGNPGPGVRAPAGSIWFDTLSVDTGVSERLVDDFEGEGDWLAGAGEIPGGDVLELVVDDVQSGERALRYDWTLLGSADDRFLVRDSPGLPVPVAIDRGTAQASGLVLGDVLTFSSPQWAIPIRIRNMIDLFPTFDPNNGGLLLADLGAVQSASRALSSGRGATVTELWINTTSGGATAAVAADLDRIYLPTIILDADGQLAEAENDPFSAAGAGGLFLVGFVGLLVVALITIVLSFASGAEERQTQVAVLRTLGYSRASASLQATFEVVMFLALGLGLGVMIGRAVSSALLGFLSVRADGSPAVPPVILHTDWGIAGLGLLILLGGALFVVFGLARGASARRPSEVLRLADV